MWIKVLKRQWRYGYRDVVREVMVKHGQFELRTIRQWTSRPKWVEVEVWVGKRKYQKQPWHAKKVLDQRALNKKAWREEKINRRNKKAGLDGSWSHRGCPRFIKQMCNKTHRRWEKDCIRRERYDEMGTWNWKRKDIFDPWLWD